MFRPPRAATVRIRGADARDHLVVVALPVRLHGQQLEERAFRPEPGRQPVRGATHEVELRGFPRARRGVATGLLERVRHRAEATAAEGHESARRRVTGRNRALHEPGVGHASLPNAHDRHAGLEVDDHGRSIAEDEKAGDDPALAPNARRRGIGGAGRKVHANGGGVADIGIDGSRHLLCVGRRTGQHDRGVTRLIRRPFTNRGAECHLDRTSHRGVPHDESLRVGDPDARAQKKRGRESQRPPRSCHARSPRRAGVASRSVPAHEAGLTPKH